MPRELICTSPTTLEWREYPEPALSAGHVRIKPQFAAAKHGTEMALVKGYAAARGGFDSAMGIFTYQASHPYPVRVGNMVVGEVIEVGKDVADVALGDRVLAPANFRSHHVLNAKACWKIGKDMPWKSAVCLDPADFAMAAVRDGHVRVGDVVAVFGLGALGLMVVQLCRLAGASLIIAADPVERRRELAAGMGAAVTLDPNACDAGREIRKATGGRGADVVIDYSGATKAMQDALRGVAYGGTVVAGAFPPPYEAGLDFGAESHLNTPQIVFSRACSQPNRDHPRWDEARIQTTLLELFASGQLSGEEIVSPVVRFDDLAKEYFRIAGTPGPHVKLGCAY